MMEPNEEDLKELFLRLYDAACAAGKQARANAAAASGGGAAGGAALGTLVLPGVGTIIGAVTGAVLGLFVGTEECKLVQILGKMTYKEAIELIRRLLQDYSFARLSNPDVQERIVKYGYIWKYLNPSQ